jgi:CheY-like chemotaxis protein
VLVVEDDPDSRELIKVLLSSEGAKVRVAAAADEALGTLRAFHPDVVVSDIAMPGHDGYFLVGALKRMHPNLPVVALTAFGSRSDAERARDAGFDHYFVKPLDPSRLVDVLARYRQQ